MKQRKTNRRFLAGKKEDILLENENVDVLKKKLEKQ